MALTDYESQLLGALDGRDALIEQLQAEVHTLRQKVAQLERELREERAA